MDRITHQPPRQQGYGSTSSLRNDSLKHMQKQERRGKGIESKNHAVSLGRTVRPCRADCPQRPRGQSGQVPRTVCKGHADRPAGGHGPSVKDNRTTRTDPRKTDRPRRSGGPSAWVSDRPLLKLGPSANQLQRKPKTKPDRKQRRARARQTRDEHATRGPSAAHGQSRKLLDLEGQLPQIIIEFPKQLKLWRQGFGDLKSVTQGCYSPKILPPNSLNHRESRIL
jgi:hypothetical protein